MRKLIHSKFELDLSSFKISDTEENNWFSDSFFVKYSFPFEIDLTEDLDVAFGFISQYNSDQITTYFDCKYIHNDSLEDAILEIESYQNRLSCTLRFGFEQLPSFDKKLSELSLDNYNLVGQTIYEHAETVISKTWPEVNYNFPQVHVDKYDPTDELWNGFLSIINNRVEGAFLINYVDGDITYNQNIMQPMPYLIHILKRGMLDGGYVLSGKILTDERLQKALIYGNVDYFTKATVQEDIYISQNSEDAVEKNYNNFRNSRAQKFYSNTVLTTPGKYNISGTVKSMRWANFPAYFQIKYRNTILFYTKASPTSLFHGSTYREYDVDVNFETIVDLNVNDITIEGYIGYTEEQIVINLTVSAIRLNDALGVAIPTITNENKINLTKSVPDITFLEYVKVIKNWFNYDLSIEGNFAIMNPIEDQINYKNAIDLSWCKVKTPLRKFSQGTSFLLKFADIEDTDYIFLPVFQNNQSFVNSNYVVDDKTTTIEINALPLPLLTRTTAQTAHGFESDNAKVYLIKYDGLYNGNNLAQSGIEYQIPSVHLKYWQKWFDFRIFAEGFLWTFKIWGESFKDIKAKTKIFAFNKYHIIKNINKTEIEPNEFSVDIETHSLK